MQDKYIILLLNTSPFICLFSKYGLNCCFRGWNYSRAKGATPQPLKKKYLLVCILVKRILILALKFIHLATLPQKIYKLTQKIQQIDNKKNL